jgi:tRNA A-37 threonylcarbamoyl transferase component Bud32
LTSGTTSKFRETPPPAVIAERYKVERVLGRGGMATVYLCLDLKTDTRVAVKVLRAELGSAVVVERFLREIEFASELDHPRIPKVLDSGVIGQIPFYVMTLVDGEPLRERLDREKQLPIEEVVRIATAVIEPMTYAHRIGIVHRDIKPGNILVGPESVHVLDFGIARAIMASADERLTSTGMAVGTPAYMSPEQALADGTIDARSDIYSLACVVYEMIAGIPPFVGATPQAIMARRFGSSPPPLSETREGIPPHIELAVSKALCRAPADRWQSAAEFGRALSGEVPSPSLHGITQQVESRRRRYGRTIAVLGAVAAIAALGFAASTRKVDRVERAREAITEWDFSTARADLERAVSGDGNVAVAQLWLASVLMSQRAPEAEWMPFALRAREAGTLKGADSLFAQAFSTHSHGDCERWQRVAEATGDRAQSMLANLARADCLREDDGVVPDPRSPSGYRFRSSHHEAASLYEGLLTVAADNGRAYAVLMPRLLDVVQTLKNNPRFGFSEGDHPEPFAAFASFASDTVGYVPFKLSAASPFRARDPAGLDLAIDENLKRLREWGQAWVRESPGDSDAHEMFALILEQNEELGDAETSALVHIGEARRIALRQADSSTASHVRNLRLAATQTRILLKQRRFQDAGTLADSVLRWPMRGLPPASDTTLASLAALTGRISRVFEIHAKYASNYRLPAGSQPVTELPPEVGRDAYRLSDFSLMGGPADSIHAVADRLEQKLGGLFPEARLPAIRMAIFQTPLSLAAPSIGPERMTTLGRSSDPFVNAARSLAAKNVARARVYADSINALHGDFAPGEITMDAVLRQGWLLAAIGDTAGSVRLLDNSLRGLSKMPANPMREAIAGSLVRAIILRAEIAWKQNDRPAAEEWSRAAVALWGRGDPEPRARVTRLLSGQ